MSWYLILWTRVSKKNWKVHKVNCKLAEQTRKELEFFGHRTVEEIDAEIELTKKLAEQGTPVAQYNLGVAFFKGLGVRIDKSTLE